MDEALAFPPPGRAMGRGLAGPSRRLRARDQLPGTPASAAAAGDIRPCPLAGRTPRLQPGSP